MFNLKEDNITYSNMVKGATFVLFALFTILFVGYTKARDNYTLAHSQTPIGQVLTMERSKVDLTIRGTYTDKEKSFLGVRIGTDESSSKLIPYSASSYLVTTTTDLNKKVIPIIFGRMGTDGDFYFIIPYPKKGTYDVAITNIETLNQDGGTQVEEILAKKDSISNIVSDATKDLSNSEDDSEKVVAKKTDTIAFNLSINPALKGNLYEPKVLNYDTLWTKNSDGTLDFEFETFWRSVYKDPLVKKARKQQQMVQKNIDAKNAEITKVIDRIDKNPNDEDADRRLVVLEKEADDLESELSQANGEVSKARQLRYDDDFYSDYTTKMFYVD